MLPRVSAEERIYVKDAEPSRHWTFHMSCGFQLAWGLYLQSIGKIRDHHSVYWLTACNTVRLRWYAVTGLSLLAQWCYRHNDDCRLGVQYTYTIFLAASLDSWDEEGITTWVPKQEDAVLGLMLHNLQDLRSMIKALDELHLQKNVHMLVYGSHCSEQINFKFPNWKIFRGPHHSDSCSDQYANINILSVSSMLAEKNLHVDPLPAISLSLALLSTDCVCDPKCT